MLSDNDVIEKKLVQAYIQSNAFWPQSRASFVLSLFSSIDAQLLRWLQDDASLKVSEVSTTSILRAADRVHSEYNVSTVLPTARASVERELHQSVKVARRTLLELHRQGNGELKFNEIRHASADLWNSIFKDDSLGDLRRFIGAGSKEAAFATKADISNRPEIAKILEILNGVCCSALHYGILEAIKPEIVHPITVIRNKIIGRSSA